MCIYRDYCVYHYKSTELISLYTLDIRLKINIMIMIIINNNNIHGIILIPLFFYFLRGRFIETNKTIYRIVGKKTLEIQ